MVTVPSNFHLKRFDLVLTSEAHSGLSMNSFRFLAGESRGITRIPKCSFEIT
jgi:hypothetical protein